MQAESSQHKNFGQPVVSASSVPQEADDRPITPAQAAARFNILEYMLRNACADGQLEHLRVVNSLWLAAAAVAEFVRSCRAKKGRFGAVTFSSGASSTSALLLARMTLSSSVETSGARSPSSANVALKMCAPCVDDVSGTAATRTMSHQALTHDAFFLEETRRATRPVPVARRALENDVVVFVPCWPTWPDS